MRRHHVVAIGLGLVLSSTLVLAQVGRGGSEWLTPFGDAQRTSWIRTDANISVESVAGSGFELQWSSKLDNQNRQLNGLSQGVTANGVTLFVPMSVVTGSSNNVYAIDNDTGYVVWQRTFGAALPAPNGACVGGITSAATRIVDVEPAAVAPPPAGRGGRAGAGYSSVVGEPGQGVPVPTRGGGGGRAAAAAPGRGAAAAAPGRAGGAPPVGDPAGAAAAAAAAAARAGGAARGGAAAAGQRGGGGFGGGRAQGGGIPGADVGGGGGFGRASGVAYAVSSDGMLHVLGLPSGKDMQRPAPFLPANASWSEPVAVGTTLYAATTGACGGPSTVYAIDLDNADQKRVVSWQTNGGPVVGSIAFAGDGTLIVAVGAGQATGNGRANAIVALDPETLQVRDWFTQPNADFVTGPTILRRGDRDIVAAATRDGRVLLLDAASLGGANHATPLFASQAVVGAGGSIAGTLSTWREASFAPVPDDAPAGTQPEATLGTQWVLVPISGRPAASTATNGAITTGAVVAYRVVEAGSGLSLEAGWTSHNLAAPATPIIVNGVVFALGTGRPEMASGAGSPAVLHAYDGSNGRAIWTSGNAISAFASPGSFWSAFSQVYVGANDGTLYAFGFLDDRDYQ